MSDSELAFERSRLEALLHRTEEACGIRAVDGRIVVAGRSGRINPNFALARYNADGSPDANFATGGLTTIDYFGASDAAENVAILPGGKIMLGGVARNQVDGYGLARVNP